MHVCIAYREVFEKCFRIYETIYIHVIAYYEFGDDVIDSNYLTRQTLLQLLKEL